MQKTAARRRRYDWVGRNGLNAASVSPLQATALETRTQMEWIFFVDLAFVLAAIAVRAFHRPRLLSGFSAVLFVWQMLLVLVEPGVMSRRVVEAATPDLIDKGFFGGLEAIHGPMFELFLAVGLSIVCWPILLSVRVRARVLGD